MGQVINMDDDKVMETRRNHDLLEFLHLSEYGLSAELLGIDQINEVPQYLVEIRKDGSVSESHWFDVETGLRTRSMRNESTPRGDMAITLDYGAMIETKGLKFEGEMTMTSGAQEMKITMTEVKLNPKLSEADYSIE